jgi:hypothetical protein
MRTEQIHIEILNHISHTAIYNILRLCARKNTIQLKVENIENANNTHIKPKTKKQKNDRTSKCQQILPQWSSVDSVRKDH